MSAPILLLTGSTGFLGGRLLRGLKGSWRVIGASRAAASSATIPIDVTNSNALVQAFHAISPAAVVHTAGIANPDECERNPELAQRVNVNAVQVLSELCASRGTRFVHFSTDLVFDGEGSWYREDDATRPLSVYGRGKLESEKAALSLCPGSVVLRVSNCYGRPLGAHTGFLDHMRENLAAGRSVPAFTDQWRTSTAGDQLPEVVLRVLANPDLRGIFHWGGADRATRYEAALAFCRTMGFDEHLIRPARAADTQFLAPRPTDTSLDSSRLAQAIGMTPIGLEQGFEALRQWIATMPTLRD